MKVKYYADTDSLYIDLSERTSKESLEVVPGVVIDFDENNQIVGIDVDNASKILNLSKFEISDKDNYLVEIHEKFPDDRGHKKLKR